PRKCRGPVLASAPPRRFGRAGAEPAPEVARRARFLWLFARGLIAKAAGQPGLRARSLEVAPRHPTSQVGDRTGLIEELVELAGEPGAALEQGDERGIIPGIGGRIGIEGGQRVDPRGRRDLP